MTLEAFKHIFSLNINNEKNIKSSENIYVGPECEDFSNTLSLKCRQEIKLK